MKVTESRGICEQTDVRLRGTFGGIESIKALPRKASIAAGTANRHR